MAAEDWISFEDWDEGKRRLPNRAVTAPTL